MASLTWCHLLTTAQEAATHTLTDWLLLCLLAHPPPHTHTLSLSLSLSPLQESVAETELRATVENGGIDEAVSKWAAWGSSLELLLFLIERFHTQKAVPSDFKKLLVRRRGKDAILAILER